MSSIALSLNTIKLTGIVQLTNITSKYMYLYLNTNRKAVLFSLYLYFLVLQFICIFNGKKVEKIDLFSNILTIKHTYQD